MEPLIHQYSKNKKMPLELVEKDYKENVIYDPVNQVSIFKMGSKTTSCHRSTDGTKPKNEADRIMDDN